MTDLAIEVAGLGRTFAVKGKKIVALRDVSFSVPHGSVVGLLGENGAGKTTLTKILATLLLPTSGMARVHGNDVTRRLREVRRDTGVVLGGDRGLYGKLTGRENLRFFAVLGGLGRRGLLERLDTALEQVHLAHAADRPVETYSKGMKQRLHIAIGTITEPRVLLLDEPTVGLDPIEAERLRSTVEQLRDHGVTVLLTSHYLLDIERLAERVLILSEGRLAADLAVDDFARMAGYTAVVTVRGTGAQPGSEVLTGGGIETTGIEQDGAVWTLRMRVSDWGGDAFAVLGRRLAGVSVLDVNVAPLRLEDVYAHVVEQLAPDTTVAADGGAR